MIKGIVNAVMLLALTQGVAVAGQGNSKGLPPQANGNAYGHQQQEQEREREQSRHQHGDRGGDRDGVRLDVSAPIGDADVRVRVGR